jgi:hypothetical protein
MSRAHDLPGTFSHRALTAAVGSEERRAWTDPRRSSMAVRSKARTIELGSCAHG